jgi:hypothetical protein
LGFWYENIPSGNPAQSVSKKIFVVLVKTYYNAGVVVVNSKVAESAPMYHEFDLHTTPAL